METAKHKGCGGEIKSDWSKTYDYEGSAIPAVRCLKCGEEILGDAEIELDGFDVPKSYRKP